MADPVALLTSEAAAARVPSGRPQVNLCYAQSLDGSLAAERGRPLALSGPESRQLTHRLRAAHDALLVGVGTVLADNPRLNVRLADGPDPRPVILDSALRTSPEAAVLAGQPWIACRPDADPARRAALQAAGAELLLVPPSPDGGLDLTVVLEELWQRGIRRLMVEGGAGVLRAFLAARLADAVCLTIAPLFVGGLPAVQGLSGVNGFPRLVAPAAEWFGPDLVLTGQLEYPQPPV